MNSLEILVKDATYKRLGVVPNPAQVAFYIRGFMVRHDLPKKLEEDVDANFIEALKGGAREGKGRKKTRKISSPKTDSTLPVRSVSDLPIPEGEMEG